MAILTGIGISIEKNPLLAAQEAARSANLNIHAERIDLAVVFASVDLSFPTLLKTLSVALRGVPIIGCNTTAIISSHGIFKHGVAVMLLSIPENAYCDTAYVRDIKTKTALVAGKELAEKLLQKSQNARRVLSTIISDVLRDEGSNLIHGLQEGLGRSFPMLGASNSDNVRLLRPHLYFNQEMISDSAVGILWGGKLNFGFGIKHGWKPLGMLRTVTKSADNIVYEIDGEPATKLYEEYLAQGISGVRKELRYVSVLYPIGIYLAGEEEYLLRNIISVEDNGSMRLHGNVPTGSQIRLMIGTKESALSATRQACIEAQRNLGTNANFVLVFNSISRYILLGRDAPKELGVIKNIFGRDVPIIGLYTYGEQAPLTSISYQGQAYFHNQTISILTMGG